MAVRGGSFVAATNTSCVQNNETHVTEARRVIRELDHDKDGELDPKEWRRCY